MAVENAIQQYVPFVQFKTHPVASEQQINDMIRELSAEGNRIQLRQTDLARSVTRRAGPFNDRRCQDRRI